MYLGLDLGTGSLKSAVVDRHGRVRWLGETTYDLTVAGDRTEIDPEVWWSCCRRVLRQAPGDLVDEVRGVGLSGQMHGLVPLGPENTVIRDAMLWPDRRAGAEAEAFAQIEQRHPGSLANPVAPGMSGPMLLWLRAHEPEAFAGIECVVSPKDWLRSRLTGESPPATDASDASATLMYDARTNDWSSDVRQLLGLSSQLPQILPSSAVAGRIGHRTALDLGLREGTPVATGAGDSAAALMGLGVDDSDSVVLNIGTAGQAVSLVDHVRADIAKVGFHQYRTAGAGEAWYVLAPVLNAGLALRWARTMLAMEWAELYEHADDALGAALDDPIFVPFLVGERDPDIGLNARGAWLELSASHDRAAMARSALVGVASYLAHRTRQLIELTSASRVILSGGSTRSSHWAQLVTTMVGHDAHVASDAHASVRGAARIAAHALGDEIAAPTNPVHLAPQPAFGPVGEQCIDRLLATAR